MPPDPLTVALIGNPNTGKSTLFNALVGVRQRVGNYPGVTVEKKVGHMTRNGRRFAVVDLPGTYSLAPRSPDEMVAVDVLLGRRGDVEPPRAVICIVDAANLERNLYAVSQVLELGLPTVVALNMMDVVDRKGITIAVPKLAERLGVAVVPIEAHRKRGIDALVDALEQAVGRPASPPPSPFPALFQQAVADLSLALGTNGLAHGNHAVPRYLVERLLLDTNGYVEQSLLKGRDPALVDLLVDARTRLAESGHPVPAVEAMSRYAWVAQALDGVVKRPAVRPVSFSDRLDRLLTHRLWGTLVFAVVMALVFQSIFGWAVPLMNLIDSGVGLAASWVEAAIGPGALRSLLVDGVLGGVGGVIVFLPQIFILFFFIAILEDCGYMARAAYLMDKLMVKVGLSGKSFIPLLSSFACAIPGVMAARVIENRRDRLTTILIAPLMSCSARLPVYGVLIAAFVPRRSYAGGLLGLQGLTMFAMYLVGIVAAIFVALILKKTILRGPTPAFVMELPGYKWPSPATVIHRMFDRGWAFVRRAGTLILVVSVIVWAMLYYPRDAATVEGPFAAQRDSLEQQLADLPRGSAEDRAEVEVALADIDNEVAGAYQRQSFLGRLGRFVEPVVRPLGWDWRIGCAAIASFPAREVVVATLGVIYDLGGELDVDNTDDSARLQAALRRATWDDTGEPVYNLPVALSIMVFFALCAQCASTLVVIKRETGSWGWPAFTFFYMTGLAYAGAFVTYRVGMWLS